jgi:YfiH family protein
MARLLFTSKKFGSFSDAIEASQTSSLEKLIGKLVQFMQQTQEDNISIVSEVGQMVEDSDSLITQNPAIALAVRVADCIPLLLFSEKQVAAVHVGRKGLLNYIALKTIAKMKELGASKIQGVVGPHICGNCYEVDLQMAEEIHALHPATSGKVGHLNRFKGLQDQLAEIPLQNLKICTKENAEYFSYRVNSESQRQIGVISL